MENITTIDLPLEIRARLAELELELSEGDITEKGYLKKKSKLLDPYTKRRGSHGRAGQSTAQSGPSAEDQVVRDLKAEGRRYTRDENRYRSDIREEAVREALARTRAREQAHIPIPSKRAPVYLPSNSSVAVPGSQGGGNGMAQRQTSIQEKPGEHDSDSDEDDISDATSDAHSTPTTEASQIIHGNAYSGAPSSRLRSGSFEKGAPRSGELPGIVPPDSSASGISIFKQRMAAGSSKSALDSPKSKGVPPDVTHNTNTLRRADRVLLANALAEASSTGAADAQMAQGCDGILPITNSSRVSEKIQALVNTLKRPKRRPLPEYFQETDPDDETGNLAPDPNAPQPMGQLIEPACGEELQIPPGLPQSLESALQRYATANSKAIAMSCLDANAKPSNTLTYAKLAQRAQRTAYLLLNKLGSKGESSLKPRDRVALVFPNSDPLSFLAAFYGCIIAGVLPVAIEVPLVRRDASCQSMGFLLSGLDIRVVLTSEACHRALPRTPQGEIVAFAGWPRDIQWVNLDQHSSVKPPRDWQPPDRAQEDEPMYIEYSYGKDGSVRGVVVSRRAALAHCRSVTAVCRYAEEEVVVCVVDCRREAGLWHAILASIFNGMHVIFVPYFVMKEDPGSWLRMVTKYKAAVAIVKSRDMHWALLAEKDHAAVNLQSLRMLLVTDGANPWSLTSCDSFLNKFRSMGLRADALCPCAVSSETMSLALRRPEPHDPVAAGRGVLSMHSLTWGLVRVDAENSLTSLTLQDCGRLLPGGKVVVVRPTGPPILCKTDEVGEICVIASYTGSGYWGLQGQTNSFFRVQPLMPDGQLLSTNEVYVRSGLIGFLGPTSSRGLVFICGSVDGMMTVGGRRHNADDIIATVLAVEPMKIIYRGRIAVFSLRLLKDERIVVVAELRQGFTEEATFKWMSRVLQAIDSIHQVNLYCLALVHQNCLPKTPLGGIHVHETRRRWLEGSLHPCNILLCPHTSVLNLTQCTNTLMHATPTPSALMLGSVVTGGKLACAEGRALASEDDPENNKRHQFLSDILQWRAAHTPDEKLFTVVNQKGQDAIAMTCSQLHKRAEKIGSLLLEKGRLSPGAHVALAYPPGVELVCAVFGCLYAGCIPVPIRPPHPANLEATMDTMRSIVQASKSVALLTTSVVVKMLKSKDAQHHVPYSSWGPVLDSEDWTRKRLSTIYRAMSADETAYLDLSVSSTGVLSGVRMTHATASALCHSQKLQCELYPTREVLLCLEPHSGLGFVLWCLTTVYCGHSTYLLPPQELEMSPTLWLVTLSQRKIRDTFCSYAAIELTSKDLIKEIPALKQRNVSLGHVRSVVVVGEERPRVQLTVTFAKILGTLGLSTRALSTAFGCRVNPCMCLQGASSPDTTAVYVDAAALRRDRVKLLEKGSPNSLCLLESGKLLPGVRVLVINPDTRTHCTDGQVGELWVSAVHNATGFISLVGPSVEEGRTIEEHNAALFAARLSGDTGGEGGPVYARTGYMGFVRRSDAGGQSEQDRRDGVFIVGSLDETITMRGMRYFPIDIENSILRCHKRIAECAIFTWSNLLVAVVELAGPDWEALDLIGPATGAVLEDHLLILGVLVVVDPGTIPLNSRGEKQRPLLRDAFVGDKLDPIYVSYNM